MEPVSEGFLLTISSISAGLIGLFLVGMTIYIQTGYDTHEKSRRVVEPYFRAATLITFIAYSVREVQRDVGLSLLTMVEVVGSVAIAAMIILPLATGGINPAQEDLVPGLLISMAIAFLGTCVLVISLFDIARFERSHEEDDRAQGREP